MKYKLYQYGTLAHDISNTNGITFVTAITAEVSSPEVSASECNGTATVETVTMETPPVTTTTQAEITPAPGTLVLCHKRLPPPLIPLVTFTLCRLLLPSVKVNVCKHTKSLQSWGKKTEN